MKGPRDAAWARGQTRAYRHQQCHDSGLLGILRLQAVLTIQWCRQLGDRSPFAQGNPPPRPTGAEQDIEPPICERVSAFIDELDAFETKMGATAGTGPTSPDA